MSNLTASTTRHRCDLIHESHAAMTTRRDPNFQDRTITISKTVSLIVRITMLSSSRYTRVEETLLG